MRENTKQTLGTIIFKQYLAKQNESAKHWAAVNDYSRNENSFYHDKQISFASHLLNLVISETNRDFCIFIITIFQTQILSNFFMVTWMSEVKNAVSSEFHLCGSKSYT